MGYPQVIQPAFSPPIPTLITGAWLKPDTLCPSLFSASSDAMQATSGSQLVWGCQAIRAPFRFPIARDTLVVDSCSSSGSFETGRILIPACDLYCWAHRKAAMVIWRLRHVVTGAGISVTHVGAGSFLVQYAPKPMLSLLGCRNMAGAPERENRSAQRNTPRQDIVRQRSCNGTSGFNRRWSASRPAWHRGHTAGDIPMPTSSHPTLYER
jgi:hypothetical protein